MWNNQQTQFDYKVYSFKKPTLDFIAHLYTYSAPQETH